jgi:hypothetical protein
MLMLIPSSSVITTNHIQPNYKTHGTVSLSDTKTTTTTTTTTTTIKQ